MAQQQQQQGKKIGFKTIILYGDQTPGIGTYGVCARQNVMTSSVLLKSSTQLYSTQLHYIKYHLTESTG